MLWYLGPRAGSVPGTPTSTQVAQYFCTHFSFGGCSDPLFTCDVRWPMLPLNPLQLLAKVLLQRRLSM